MRSPETPYPSELAELDKPRSECGVFGVYAPGANIPQEVSITLEDMQHRGHESAGLAAIIEGRIEHHSGDGIAPNVITADVMQRFQSEIAIGHNRYSTTGESSSENAHPFVASGELGELALSHNGNLTNFGELKQMLSEAVVNGTTDSELAAVWIAGAPGKTWGDKIQHFMRHAEGAYSMAMLTDEGIYAFRDPHGFRPLHLAVVDGGGVAVSSETRVFRSLSYHPRREVAPGEIVLLNQDGIRTISHKPHARQAFCLFEYVYFSGPDSEIEGRYVDQIRDEIGRALAQEDIRRGTVPDVDVVFGIPESGWPMGEGYADELGLFHKKGLIKNPTRGRTFIDPGNPRRIVERKFNPLPHVVGGKRVCVVDDSIVRANTMPYIIEMLHDAGATEVHVRAGCPPLQDTCHMGVNIAARDELIANRHPDTEGIRQEIGAHSLQYLSIEGLRGTTGKSARELCDACMTGEYPIPVKDKQDDYQLAD